MDYHEIDVKSVLTHLENTLVAKPDNVLIQEKFVDLFDEERNVQYTKRMKNLKIASARKIDNNKESFVLTKDGIVKWRKTSEVVDTSSGQKTEVSDFIGMLDIGFSDFNVRTMCISYNCSKIP